MKFGPFFPKRPIKGPIEPQANSAAEDAGAHGVEGERGIASVNQSRSLQSRVSNLLAMGLMAVLGLGLLSWYYAQAYSHRHRTKLARRPNRRRRAICPCRLWAA